MIYLKDENDVQIWCDYQEETKQTSADYFLRLRFYNFRIFASNVANYVAENGWENSFGMGNGDGCGNGCGWGYSCDWGTGDGFGDGAGFGNGFGGSEEQ